MELQQLKYFLKTAEMEHITRASEELHIAQPALTQCIHRLESELGTPLFERKGRNIKLNQDGIDFKKKLEPLIFALENLSEEFKNRRTRHIPPVKIEISAGSDIIGNLLIEFKEKNPEIAFNLTQGKSSGSQISITTSAYDAVLQPEDAVFTEEIFLAVPLSSLFARKPEIDLKDVAGENFIAFAGSKPLRQICDSFCKNAGFTPSVVFESDSPMLIRKLIEGGMGIGFWPAFSWGSFTSTKALLLPVKNSVCKRNLIVHITEEGTQNPHAVKFYTYMISYLRAIN